MKQKKPMRKYWEDKCLLLSAWRDYQGTWICNCGEKHTQWEGILNYIENWEDTLTANTCLTSETKWDIATTYPGWFHKEFIEWLIETEWENAITFAKCFNKALEDVYTFEAYLTEEWETADTSADCDDLNTNIDTLIFEYLPYLWLIDAKYLWLSWADLINDTLISAYLEAVVEKYSN